MHWTRLIGSIYLYTFCHNRYTNIFPTVNVGGWNPEFKVAPHTHSFIPGESTPCCGMVRFRTTVMEIVHTQPSLPTIETKSKSKIKNQKSPPILPPESRQNPQLPQLTPPPPHRLQHLLPTMPPPFNLSSKFSHDPPSGTLPIQSQAEITKHLRLKIPVQRVRLPRIQPGEMRVRGLESRGGGDGRERCGRGPGLHLEVADRFDEGADFAQKGEAIDGFGSGFVVCCCRCCRCCSVCASGLGLGLGICA